MQSKPQMKEFIVDLLKSKLSSFYYFHNYEHTLYVLDNAVEIAQAENCTEKEIKLIHAAALWHDAGYINIYTGHEEESCMLARQYLPEFDFAKDDIDTICGMIMATKIPQQPQNKLEEIIADADLVYLGTASAAAMADKLFRELQHLNPSLTEAEWKQTQISFIKNHYYFTRFCKEQTEPAKKLYLDELQHEAT